MEFNLEEIVIGKILVDPDSIHEISDILNKESFSNYNYQVIYNACVDVANENKEVNIVNVSEKLIETKYSESELRKFDRDQIFYKLSTALNSVSTPVNLALEAKLVAQKSIRRKFSSVTEQFYKKSKDNTEDIADIIESTQAELEKLSSIADTSEVKKLSDILPLAVKEMKTKESAITYQTGFKTYDEYTTGLTAPDLIIIAARPAMGKTALAVEMLTKMALNGTPVAIYSLEMSATQLAIRIISSVAEINNEHIKKKEFTYEDLIKIDECLNLLENIPLYIIDKPSLSINEFMSSSKKLKRKHDIKVIAVDYLQLMTAGKSGNREQEVSTISRRLKVVAKNLNVPVIALSQLNRSVETRGGDKRPQLSDLRESGSIEQDADMVIFIHRPEYYGIVEYEDGEITKGIAEIIFAKYRNGSTGSIKMRFVPSTTSFYDILEDKMPF